MDINTEILAKLAYESYVQNDSGEVVPEWEDLPEWTKEHWNASAFAVSYAVVRSISLMLQQMGITTEVTVEVINKGETNEGK